MLYSPTLSTLGLSSESSSTSVTSLRSSSDVSATSSSIMRASSIGPATTSSSPSSTTAAATSGGSLAPIGAIVGGVVGGVAVIALLALGLVLLLRRRRHPQGPGSDPHTSMNPPGGYPSQPPPSLPAMQQQFQQANLQPAPSPASYVTTAPLLDSRSSIAKLSPTSPTPAVYDPTISSSPPSQSQSPGPILPAYQATNTITSAAAATAASQGVSPTTCDAPQQQRPGTDVNQGYHSQMQPAHHQQQQHGGHYFEMPTAKSDRELRELA